MVKEPEKELRFTRANQAIPAFILSSLFIAVGVTIMATGYYRDINPDVPHALWGLIPLVVAAGFFWVGWHLTKHAYVILSPIGVEIFPLFWPAKNMQLILWQEIAMAESSADHHSITFHFNRKKTAGVHLSLRPVPRPSRALLAKAAEGRVSNQHS